MTGKITGPLRDQSDWAQNDEHRLGFIKNKPFYDNRKSEPLTLSHDGNIEGLEAIYFPCYEATYYKISETVPTYEESIQGEGVMRIFVEGVQDGEIPFTTAATIGNFSTFWLVEHDNADVPVCFFLSEDTVFSGGSIWGFETDTKVTKGIWIVSSCGEMEGMGHFEMFVKSLSFPSVTTGELKTLDKKFLPEGVGATITLFFSPLDGCIYNNADMSNSDNRTTLEELKQILESGRQLRLYTEIDGDFAYYYPNEMYSYEGVGYVEITIEGSAVELHTAEYTAE